MYLSQSINHTQLPIIKISWWIRCVCHNYWTIPAFLLLFLIQAPYNLPSYPSPYIQIKILNLMGFFFFLKLPDTRESLRGCLPIWVTACNMMLSSPTGFTANDRISFFLMTVYGSIVHILCIFLSSYLILDTLFLVSILDVVNSPAINVERQTISLIQWFHCFWV